jgi:hypothetical protein
VVKNPSKSKVGFAHPWLREFPGYAMLAGASTFAGKLRWDMRADYVGKVILKYGLLTQGGVR